MIYFMPTIRDMNNKPLKPIWSIIVSDKAKTNNVEVAVERATLVALYLKVRCIYTFSSPLNTIIKSLAKLPSQHTIRIAIKITIESNVKTAE